MSAAFAHLLVWLVVALTVFCSVAMLIMRTSLERLHFTAPVVALAPLLLALAVILTAGLGVGVAKLLFITVLLVLTNAVLSHATGRAARIRRDQTWMPATDDRVEEE